MPQAPDIYTLLDFEGQFEAAAQAVMASAGVVALLSHTNAEQLVFNTGIAADYNGAMGSFGEIPAPSNWPSGQPNPQEYQAHSINLEYRVEVPRDDNASSIGTIPQKLAEVRARTRAAHLRSVMPFNDSNLPYYRVSDIRPGNAFIAYELARNIDVCSVRFLITFRIKPDAWPAWVIG